MKTFGSHKPIIQNTRFLKIFKKKYLKPNKRLYKTSQKQSSKLSVNLKNVPTH